MTKWILMFWIISSDGGVGYGEFGVESEEVCHETALLLRKQLNRSKTTRGEDKPEIHWACFNDA